MFGFLLSAYKSGSGKTVLSSAIVRAYVEEGYHVSPYKCGPDYVDTLWLSKAAKFGEDTFYKGGTLRARNLDTVLMSRSEVKREFYKGLKIANNLASGDTHSKGCCAVVEGVMGLFDGLDPITFEGSSYDIAKSVDLPVILVIDVKGVAASVISLLVGIVELAKDVNIVGVILNKVSSKRHEEILRSAINYHVPLCKIVGCIPYLDELSASSRQLGLGATVDEQESVIAAAAEVIKKYIDFDELASISKLSQSLIDDMNALDISMYEPKANLPNDQRVSSTKLPKIAYIAYDDAFNFYYQSTLELLQSMGYEAKLFSALADEPVQDADLIFIGGGYPERYAEILSQNKVTVGSIREHHKRGVPIYSEGGGFIYLSRELRLKPLTDCSHHSNIDNAHGCCSGNNDLYTKFDMVGLFDIICEMTSKRQRLGYYRAELTSLIGVDLQTIGLNEVKFKQEDNQDANAVAAVNTYAEICVDTNSGVVNGNMKSNSDDKSDIEISSICSQNFLALAHAFHYGRVVEDEGEDKSMIKLIKMSNKEISGDGFKNGSAYGGFAHYMPMAGKFFSKILECL